MSTPSRKILVPHDGSEISDKAVNNAIELARAFDYEIIILHIIDDKLIPSEPILSFVSEKFQYSERLPSYNFSIFSGWVQTNF